MGSELELYEARVSYFRFVGAVAEIHFSYACIYKTQGLGRRDTGRGWSQEAVLLLQQAEAVEPLPPLPNIVMDGYLEVDGVRHELIPLPFERSSSAQLHLEFSDGTALEVRGVGPMIKLLGDKVFFKTNREL